MNYKPVNYLTKGDTICILCTARFARLADIKPAMALLESWGFKVKVGTTIGLVDNQLGGSITDRVTDFVTAYKDPTVDAIWVARGGYGTVQLIDLIVEQLKEVFIDSDFKQPLVIGYSDVTVLHTALQQQGLPSLHAFMPLELPHKPLEILEGFKQSLLGVPQEIVFNNEDNLDTTTITAPIIGGNLSIIYSLLGSDTLPDFSGHVLFIEDIDEYLYHIERMLYALKRAGKLKGLKAMLVGGMTGMRDNDVPFGKTAQEIINDLTQHEDYPVIFNYPAGHVAANSTIVMGRKMTITITNNTITCTQ